LSARDWLEKIGGVLLIVFGVLVFHGYLVDLGWREPLFACSERWLIFKLCV
jgi:cytochrome c biogenesis protein CcdA